MVPVLAISVAYNLPRFFEWRAVSDSYLAPCHGHGHDPGGDIRDYYDNYVDYHQGRENSQGA